MASISASFIRHVKCRPIQPRSTSPLRRLTSRSRSDAIPVEAEAVALQVHLDVGVGEVEPGREPAVTDPVLTDGGREPLAADHPTDARLEGRLARLVRLVPRRHDGAEHPHRSPRCRPELGDPPRSSPIVSSCRRSMSSTNRPVPSTPRRELRSTTVRTGDVTGMPACTTTSPAAHVPVRCPRRRESDVPQQRCRQLDEHAIASPAPVDGIWQLEPVHPHRAGVRHGDRMAGRQRSHADSLAPRRWHSGDPNHPRRHRR